MTPTRQWFGAAREATQMLTHDLTQRVVLALGGIADYHFNSDIVAVNGNALNRLVFDEIAARIWVDT